MDIGAKVKCELKIRTEIRDGYHHLAEQYCTKPFGLLRFDKRHAHDPWLRYMIRSSSPGILDGDHYYMDFHVVRGTNLGLETQAYNRIHSMQPGGSAYQSQNIVVEEEASLQYIPYPTSPHRDSVFDSENIIKIAGSSKVIWGEIITCGRKLYGDGEIFEFNRLSNYTRIYLDEKLIFKDRLYLNPKEMDLKAIGQFEGYTHQATVFVYNQDLREEYLYGLLEKAVEGEEAQIEYAMTETVGGGVLVRIVGTGGEQLYKIAKNFEYSILDEIIEPIF